MVKFIVCLVLVSSTAFAGGNTSYARKAFSNMACTTDAQCVGLLALPQTFNATCLSTGFCSVYYGMCSASPGMVTTWNPTTRFCDPSVVVPDALTCLSDADCTAGTTSSVYNHMTPTQGALVTEAWECVPVSGTSYWGICTQQVIDAHCCAWGVVMFEGGPICKPPPAACF